MSGTALGNESSGGGGSWLNNDYKVKAAAAAYHEAQEEAEKEKNDQAEAYARGLGFESADQAEDHGVDTGKKY